MEYQFKKNIDKTEYQKFIKQQSIVSFMQDYRWANVKDNWKSLFPGLYQDGKLVAVCLLLIKKITKGIYVGYIPRGYIIDYQEIHLLQEFTKKIKQLAKEEHCYMVKIDPNFCYRETSILEFEKKEPFPIPITLSKNNEKYHQNLIKLGYKHQGFPNDIHKTFQPRFHMMIPLIDEHFNQLTEEDVLKSFKKRIRSYLGNYHQNRGVFYEHTNDISKLDEFVHILNETEKRQGIHLRNKTYFKKIMKHYQDQAVLFFGKLDLSKYLDFLMNNHGKEEEINEIQTLINKGKSTLTLSAALVIMPTNTKGIRICEYLYAGNELLFHKLQISYGLVYDICKYSIAHHCSYCNLGGIDGNLTDHLATYKSRFNSIVMEFIGEYDLPIKKYLYYPIKFFLPILKKGYHLIKK